MAILTTGNTFADGDQVTSTKLNNIANAATFASGAVDDSTTQLSSGAIIVKDLGVSTGKIAASAVTTAKIADSNVTKAKIENVANMKALGNVSGGAAAPAEVSILDEDNMASNSATSLATQQSIKAYADSKVDGTGAGSFTTLAASGDVTFDTTTLKVDSSNNRVGIGTASPAQTLDVDGGARVTGTFFVGTDDTDPHGLLEVYGGGTGQNEGGEIKLRTAADFDSTYDHYFIDTYQDDLRIGRDGIADIHLTSAGKVGIGTTSPSYLLDINDDAGLGTGLRVTGGGSGGSIATFARDVGSTGTVMINAKSGDPQIKFSSASDNWSIGLDSTVFNICDGNEVGSDQRLVIDTAGKVGIGATIPAALLHVKSSNSDTAETVAGFGNGDIDVGLEIKTNGNGGSSLDWGFNAKNARNLVFDTNQNERMRITSTGNVGIGDSFPSAPLTVTSTTGGVLLPRMTTTQMNAISSPANGEMIYNTTANKFYGYANGSWVALH